MVVEFYSVEMLVEMYSCIDTQFCVVHVFATSICSYYTMIRMMTRFSYVRTDVLIHSVSYNGHTFILYDNCYARVRNEHTFISYNDTYDNEILYGRTDVLVHIHGMRDSVSYECAKIIHAPFCLIRVYMTYIRS